MNWSFRIVCISSTLASTQQAQPKKWAVLAQNLSQNTLLNRLSRKYPLFSGFGSWRRTLSVANLGVVPSRPATMTRLFDLNLWGKGKTCSGTGNSNEKSLSCGNAYRIGDGPYGVR